MDRSTASACRILRHAVLASTWALLALSQATFADQMLTIVDQLNQPVTGATILIGFEDGNPFPGNRMTTDASGQAPVPSDWKAALPLTVVAPGYVTSTVPLAVPGAQILELSPQESNQEIEIAGEAIDFGRLRQDGKVDFALVMPSLRPDALLSFDLSTVMSPKVDVITVVGREIEIPSNIALPDQTETYIFPINFNKPQYRTYVREPGQYRVTATRGQFPLQRVVNDIRAGKSMFEVINHFSFMGSGAQLVNASQNVGGVNLSVNQTRFEGQFDVKAPKIKTDEVIISLGLNEVDGLLNPTDLKRLRSEERLALKKNNTGGSSVISLLLKDAKSLEKQGWLYDALTLRSIFPLNTNIDEQPNASDEQSFSQMSFSNNPADALVNPTFLPLIAQPEIRDNVLITAIPAMPAGMSPLAMYWIYSEIEKVGEGSVKSEKRTRQWEILSPSWRAQIELPRLALEKRPDRQYRWEVLFLARKNQVEGGTPRTNRVDLSSITHVTRNAIDL